MSTQTIQHLAKMRNCEPVTMELLDVRLCLSVAVIGINLRIEGNDADNAIRVTQSASQFAVKIDGKAKSFPRTGIKQIVVSGNNGNDKIDLRGNTPRVLVHGDEGDDTILSGKGNDRLFGDENDDIVKGGAGNDTIEGGEGEDALYGNAGNDSFHANDEFWSDFLDGGSGEDRAKVDFSSTFFDSDEVDSIEDVA
jgi:Ca2+-binding RTX toxin-like protein